MNSPPSYHLKWGVFYVLIAWLGFTLMATVSRIAMMTVPVTSLVFFQNLISWLVFLPWVFKHGIGSLRTQRLGLILVRSLTGVLGFTCLFLAVARISLVDAVLLNNAAPLFVPFAVWLWLKTPINHKLWPGIVAGFIGIVLILKPGKEIVNLGALFALGAALGLCITMIALRLLSKTERNHTVLFYYFLIGSIVFLPPAYLNWKHLHAAEWLELGAIGLLSSFAQWCFLRAFHHAKPSVLGPFCYLAVVYSGLIEWALWGKVPDAMAWLGIALVAAGGIWTIVSQPKDPQVS